MLSENTSEDIYLGKFLNKNVYLGPFFALYEGLKYWKCQKTHLTLPPYREVLKIVLNSHSNNTAQIQTNLRPLLFLLSSGHDAQPAARKVYLAKQIGGNCSLFSGNFDRMQRVQSHIQEQTSFTVLYSMRKRVKNVLSYMEKSFLFFPSLHLIP